MNRPSPYAGLSLANLGSNRFGDRQASVMDDDGQDGDSAKAVNVGSIGVWMGFHATSAMNTIGRSSAKWKGEIDGWKDIFADCISVGDLRR